MTTARMLAFVTAALITALLLDVVSYSLPAPQPTQAGAGIVAGAQSTAE
jgi:hypothetical protein